MSKEKIIGLSVLGVLAVTLAGVTAWRMMRAKSANVDETAISATDSNAASNPNADEIGPTVLASASNGGDSIADRLSGKTKINGGWQTVSGSNSSASEPTLPTGAQSPAGDSRERYAQPSGTTTLRVAASDERPLSYMPREEDPAAASDTPGMDESASLLAATTEQRYAAGDTISPLEQDEQEQGYTEQSYPEQGPARFVEHGANVPDEAHASNDGYGSAGDDRFAPVASVAGEFDDVGEAIQVVEPAPRELTPEQMEAQDQAQRLAVRAADDARYAALEAREAEAVQIASDAIEPTPAALTANNVTSNNVNNNANGNGASARPSAGNAAADRYGDGPRYAPTGQESGGVGAGVAPQPGSPTQEPVESAPYRESVYREPAAAAHDAPPRGAGPTALGVAMKSAAHPASPPPRENTGKYYVEPGDSFWTISQKVYGQGGFFKALQEHNRARFLSPANMQVGDEVLTPTVAELRELYSGLCPKERIAKPGSPAAAPVAHQIQPASVRHYEVQAGDTLFDIARYELGDAKRWPEIYQLNRVALGKDIDFVKPGTRLMLPMDAPLPSAAPAGEYERGDVLTRQPGGALQR